jgi:hypothetical protein
MAGDRNPAARIGPAAVVFVASTLAWLGLYLFYPSLQDTDSYFHLALAREYGQHGILETLPWARFTDWSTAYGDFQLLFHLLLVPFASLANAELGGAIALALLDGTIFTLLGLAGARAIGRWGWLLPLAVYATSTEAGLRLVRLRPELLALVLLLVAAELAARGRYRSLGLVSALFALAYSAVHAFAGVWILVFLYRGWRHRHWDWRLPLYVLAGLALGMVIHPQFPANLDSLVLVAQVPFVDAGALGSGSEIAPHDTSIALMTQLGFWLGLWVTWSSRRPTGGPIDPAAAARRDAFGVLTATFGTLYLLHARFAVYAFPFAALWLLWNLAARGESVGRRMAWFGRGLPTAVGLLVCAALAVHPLSQKARDFAARASAGPDGVRDAERTAVGAKLPPGANVAATWKMADLMVFFAPEARFLEVLDPLPMALAHPEAFATKQRIFAGTEPDTPLALARVLDSDYWLISRFSPEEAGALTRLLGDPRFEILHDGHRVLARLRPGANRAFLLDWRIAPADTPLPIGPAVPTRGWIPYPRPADARWREIEGLVDLTRLVPPAGCVRMVHDLPVDTPSPLRLTLAAAGATSLHLDDRLLVMAAGGRGARLDQAIGVEARLDTAEPHRLSVETCAAGRDFGFYLLRDRVPGTP